jgi:hypothetical protein
MNIVGEHCGIVWFIIAACADDVRELTIIGTLHFGYKD